MIVVDSPASAAGALSVPVSSNPTSLAAHVGVDDAVFLATYFVAPIVHDVFFTSWARLPELEAN